MPKLTNTFSEIDSAIQGVAGSGLDATGVSQSLSNTRNSFENGSPVINDKIFSPLDIDGLYCWFDSVSSPLNAADERASGSDTVETLIDNSGNGRNAARQAGAPTVTVNGGFGGKQAIDFSGGASFATTDGGLTTDDLTVFVVSKNPTPAHSTNRLKLSISSINFWLGSTGTTGARDLTISTLSGGVSSQPSEVCTKGVDVIRVDNLRGELLFATDGVNKISKSTAETAKTSVTGTLGLNSANIRIGTLSGTNFLWTGSISEVVVFDVALSDNDTRRVLNYLSDKYETRKTVVCIGDSITSGTGSASGATQVLSSSGDNYPNKLLSSLGTNYKVRIDAFPGRNINQALNQSPAFTGVLNDSELTDYIIFIGTNTLAFSKSTLHALDEYRRLCLSKRGKNKRVFACTMLRREYTNQNQGDQITSGFNTLLRSVYTEFADGLIDLAADTRLQDFTDTTYFSGDNTHPNSTGYQVISDLVETAITE